MTPQEQQELAELERRPLALVTSADWERYQQLLRLHWRHLEHKWAQRAVLCKEGSA